MSAEFTLEIVALPSPVQSKCEPDPFNPGSIICTSSASNDDRQVVSHFFGRNKRATATIPDGVFPLLCRQHYQEKQYRWKGHAGDFAAYQCHCILLSLQRMNKLTFTDEHGNKWPRYCGFELQMQKPHGTSEKLEKEADISKAVPEWLQRMCTYSEEDKRDHNTFGDRKGVRYDFQQLSRIVRAIASWCLSEQSPLPPVEALPVTIGMYDEYRLSRTREVAFEARRERNIALTCLNKARQQNPESSVSSMRALRAAEVEFREAQKMLEVAEHVMSAAEIDLESSKSTLPQIRQVRKRAGPTEPSGQVPKRTSSKRPRA